MQNSGLSREQLKSKAYSAATTRIRQEYRDGWNRILQEEYQKVGISWQPPLTEAQKALQTVAELMERHPEIVPVIQAHTVPLEGLSVADLMTLREAVASVALDRDSDVGTRSLPDPDLNDAVSTSHAEPPREDSELIADGDPADDFESNDYEGDNP